MISFIEMVPFLSSAYLFVGGCVRISILDKHQCKHLKICFLFRNAPNVVRCVLWCWFEIKCYVSKTCNFPSENFRSETGARVQSFLEGLPMQWCAHQRRKHNFVSLEMSVLCETERGWWGKVSGRSWTHRTSCLDSSVAFGQFCSATGCTCIFTVQIKQPFFLVQQKHTRRKQTTLEQHAIHKE